MSYRVGPVTGAKIKAGPHGPPDGLNPDGYFSSAGGACDQLTDMLWLLTLSWELKFLTYSWDSLQF